MGSERQGQLLFIIGTGRCGSTMTHEVLARHPATGFISNVDANLPSLNLKGRFNSALLKATPQALTQRDRRSVPLMRLHLRFGPSEAYELLNRHVTMLLSEAGRDPVAEDVTPWLRRRLTRFFEARIAAQRKPVFLCKFSGWPRAGLLHEVFPGARFLHLMRDGRAVADSLLRRPWWRGYAGPWGWQFGALSDDYRRTWERSGRSHVVLAGIQWMLLMDAFDEARGKLPDEQWMEVRYEDLVAGPRERVADILRFADLPWTSDFERAFARYEFVTERRDAFRTGLTAAQAGMLDEVMGQHLRRKGYEASPP